MPAHFAKKILTTVVLFASIATATSVFAHAHLKSETPAAESTVTAPAELRLVFSEGVEEKFTKVEITTGGAAVPVKSIATDPGDKKTLIVTPEKPLAAGQYQIKWHAVSVDTHKSEGHYTFKVGN